MPEQNYKYEAFISYRHNARDSFIARAISRMSEGYTIPTPGLRNDLGRKRVGKLFRDEDELPFGGVLNDAIVDAIRNSRKFIMLLNHDYLDENHWCVYELAEFLKSHHYRDVIVVVSSGSIAELTKLAAASMNRRDLNFYNDADETGKPVDPFAIELAPYEKEKELAKALKNSRLKLLAGILSVDYDDLNRREHRREIRRLWAVLTPVIAVISAFAITVTSLALEINEQRILAQNNEMNLLMESSKSAVADGDRLAGIRYAIAALDIYNILYPGGDTEKSEQIRQSLDAAVYYQGFQLLAPIKNNSRKFGAFRYSPDDRYILAEFGEFTAALIEARTGDILKEITKNRPYLDNYLAFFGFSPDGKYFVTGFGAYTCEIVVWKTGDEPEEIASISADSNHVEGYFISDNEIIFGRWPSFDNEVKVLNVDTLATRNATEAELRNFDDDIWAEMERSSDRGKKSSPDGKYSFEYDMAGDAPVRIYEEPSGLLVGELLGMNVVSGFSHDGRYFIAGNSSGFCGIFGTPNSASAGVKELFEDDLYQYPSYFEVILDEALAVESFHTYDQQIYRHGQPFMLNDPSGRFFAIVYPDSFVEVWDLERDPVNATYGLREHIGMIQDAYMTAELLVTAGYDGRVMIFELGTGLLNNSFSVENGIVALNLDPAGTKAIAVGRSLKHAYVYDLTTGLQIYRLDAEPGDEIDYAAIGFSEDGSIAVAKQKSGRAIIGTVFLSLDELKDYARKAAS